MPAGLRAPRGTAGSHLQPDSSHADTQQHLDYLTTKLKLIKVPCQDFSHQNESSRGKNDVGRMTSSMSCSDSRFSWTQSFYFTVSFLHIASHSMATANELSKCEQSKRPIY